jgi:hypothetical protein
VLVTHSQNWFHAEAPWRCWMVVVMSTEGVPESGMDDRISPVLTM